MIDPTPQLTAIVLLALVFGFAAYSKLTAWTELEGVVRNYRMLPQALVVPVARALPWIEGALALMILSPPVRRAAALAMLGLLIVFAVAIALNLARGRSHIDCGCFRSTLRQNLSWWLVLRNVLLIVACVITLIPTAPRELVLTDMVTVLAGALSLFIAYLCVGFVTLKPPPRFDEIASARAALDQSLQGSVSTTWKRL
ncbi:MAG TPA: MauE/DoxX family redox-associated membrane protein [Burkholderiales bacterium]|nr:MauE/DoxX family redox-associated membrane protein [Burkholderiales bacterium]